MKTLTTTLLVVLISSTAGSAFAWSPSSGNYSKEYTFKYKLSGNSLEIKKTAGSYEEAFDQAAQQCFNHFKGGMPVTEDRGLDIIDVCANPRT